MGNITNQERLFYLWFMPHGNQKHGFTRRKCRIYRIWSGMKSRCNSEIGEVYEKYKNRGIIVCDEWQEFLPFYEWAMKNGYNRNRTLDRIDNDGNYEPSNCRWTNYSVQNKNKRKLVRNPNILRDYKID